MGFSSFVLEHVYLHLQWHVSYPRWCKAAIVFQCPDWMAYKPNGTLSLLQIMLDFWVTNECKFYN